ncbi:ApbE family protein [Acidaminococcus sp. BV3L6]|nr:ApbE family protein [Acidaminococcus sp. BV3L6]
MILLSSLFLQGCFFQDQNSTIHHEDTRFMMDTIVTIETTGKSEDTLKSTTDKAFAAFQEIADETDSYAPHGPKDLYAINEKAGTGPQKAAPHLLAILKSAASHPHQELSLTLGPVIKIWNDNREKKTVPSRAEIADALTLTKGSRVRIDETTGTLTLMPGTQIDLGAVAKGYAVEEAAKVLQKEGGFQTALINAGGNIKVLGEKPDHKPWRIGIQDPKDPEKVLGNPFGSSRYSHCNKRRLSALLRSKRRPLPSHPQSADGLAQPQCPFRYSRYSIGLLGRFLFHPALCHDT